MAVHLKKDRQTHVETESTPVVAQSKTVRVDLKRAARDIEYAQSVGRGYKGFTVYDDRFDDVLEGAELIHVQAREYQFAHEAGVYIKRTNKVYFTANFQTCNPVDLYCVDEGDYAVTKLEYENVVQANGACNYQDSVLYCSQGNKTTPSGLVLVDPVTNSSEVLVTNFNGRPFNSVNDVVIHHARDEIWFTDPTYGYEQAFRPPPELPSQIYRFKPSTGEVWMVADGFEQCNGLCFSPDYTKMYVTDTGVVQAHSGPGDGHNFSANPRLPSTIYEFDVVDAGTRLANRKVFAFCDTGAPDGIKCDEIGNVYSGCGDGVHVWDPHGKLLGKINVGSVCANFCFTKAGIWMLCEKELYLCKLKAKGALVQVECE